MIRSTCPYCGTGCGLILTPTADGVDVRGDPDHPANFGRLCSKGSALGETVGLRGRLLQPQIHGQRAEWDTALDLVAETFTAAIRPPQLRLALRLAGTYRAGDIFSIPATAGTRGRTAPT